MTIILIIIAIVAAIAFYAVLDEIAKKLGKIIDLLIYHNERNYESTTSSLNHISDILTKKDV
jgi:hypothetical protein